MATVTAQQLYSALRASGYSDAAARGIMANAAYESGGQRAAGPYDLAATGDNGCSHGLLQWNTCGGGGYKSMAGQPLAAQIAYMHQTIPQSCTKLGSATAVAGCITANFENCAGAPSDPGYPHSCQPGGYQYNVRQAAARTLAAMHLTGAPAGAAPAPAGGATPAPSRAGTANPGTTAQAPGAPGNNASGSGGAPATLTANRGPGPIAGAAAASDCLISIPFFGGCIIAKSNVRAWLSVMILGAGTVVFLAGVALLFVNSAPGRAAGRVAGGALEGAGTVAMFIPGGEVAGAAAVGAGHAVRGRAKSATASARQARAAHRARREARTPPPTVAEEAAARGQRRRREAAVSAVSEGRASAVPGA